METAACRYAPAKAQFPIQGPALALVLFRQGGQIGEQLKGEIDGHHPNHYAQGQEPRREGTAEQGEEPVGRRPEAKPQAEGPEQLQSPALAGEQGDGLPDQQIARPVWEEVEGTQADVDIKKHEGPGNFGQAIVDTGAIHGRPPSGRATQE